MPASACRHQHPSKDSSASRRVLVRNHLAAAFGCGAPTAGAGTCHRLLESLKKILICLRAFFDSTASPCQRGRRDAQFSLPLVIASTDLPPYTVSLLVVRWVLVGPAALPACLHARKVAANRRVQRLTLMHTSAAPPQRGHCRPAGIPMNLSLFTAASASD